MNSLISSADENAEKAERLFTQLHVLYMNQSNSMCRTAKEKREEVTAVEQQI